MSAKAKAQSIDSHRVKSRMGRKMMTRGDIVGKKSIWDTDRWGEHVRAVRARVLKIEMRG